MPHDNETLDEESFIDSIMRESGEDFTDEEINTPEQETPTEDSSEQTQRKEFSPVMIANLRAQVTNHFRETNDLDVSFALCGIVDPDLIEAITEDESFHAQIMITQAMFIKERIMTVKKMAEKPNSLGLSANKFLLEHFHSRRFNKGAAKDDDPSTPSRSPVDAELVPVSATDESHDEEVTELLKAALQEEDEERSTTPKDTGANGASNGANNPSNRVEELKEKIRKFNEERAESFEMDIPKNKRKAVVRLNK